MQTAEDIKAEAKIAGEPIDLTEVEMGTVVTEMKDSHGLERRLKARHIFMISIGSSIGMGLWLGTGSSLYKGGPASLWIGFWLACAMAWSLNQAIGEMAVLYPVPSAFPQWARGMVDPALGFTLGWTYWFSYMITIPNELSGLCTVLAFWNGNINPAVWISVFLVVLIFINIFAVNVFAEAETVMSTLKFCWIFVIIICSIVVSAGGGPTHQSTGFHYWRTEPFKNGFKGFLAVMPNCIFTMSGLELCGVVAAEAKNPKYSIPVAVNSIWIRLGLFYLIGSLMVTILVSPDNENLFGGSGVNASPFVIAFDNAGLPGLGDAHNVIILISVLSSGNAAMYAGPRMLMGLAELRMAPRVFMKCDKKGRPWYGLALTTIIGGGLAYLNVDNSGATVFGWFSNLTSLTTLYVWGLIFLSNLRMRAAWTAQGRSLTDLPWKSKVIPWSSWFGFILCILLIIEEFYLAVWPLGDSPSAKNFFANYVSLVMTIACYLGAKIFYRGPIIIKKMDINLDNGRRIYGPEDDLPEPDFFHDLYYQIRKWFQNAPYGSKTNVEDQ